MNITVPEDKNWKQQREERWDNVYSRNMEVNYPEEVCLIIKQWYLYGDLTGLMSDQYWTEKEVALSLDSVMRTCPIVDLEEYIQFFQDYCKWMSEKELDYWGRYKENRDENFITRFFFNYVENHTDSTKKIYEHMLGLFLPNDEGIITFPYQLGTDNWQPQLQVSPCDSAFDVFTNICRYLFDEEELYEGYSHVHIAMPIVHYISGLNPHYFNTELDEYEAIDHPSPPAPRNVNGAGQAMMRAVLGNLLGYKNYYNDYEGELRHNDPALEQQLKELLADLKMPDGYYKLIGLIHAHPDDYIDYSEQ